MGSAYTRITITINNKNLTFDTNLKGSAYNAKRIIREYIRYISHYIGMYTMYANPSAHFPGFLYIDGSYITFTTKDLPSTTNTHNTELQMVKVHINMGHRSWGRLSPQ